MSSDSFVNQKYGYVENVKEEYQYKNVDYRDTLVPLWTTLYEQKEQGEQDEQGEQSEINLALCAAIIQLGKYINRGLSSSLVERLNQIEDSILLLEERIISLEKKLSGS